MSLAHAFSRLLPWLAVLLALVAPLPAQALAPDKSSISVGETSYVRPNARVVLNAQWTASDELQTLASDGDGAAVKGIKTGKEDLSLRWPGGQRSTRNDVLALAGQLTIDGGQSGSDSHGLGTVTDADMQRMGELLKRYRDTLGDLEQRFRRQDSATEGRRPQLGDADSARLVGVTAAFFRELNQQGYSLRDLQQFRDRYMATGSGGSPLFPGQGGWDQAFLGVERALMMGRAIQVQQLWMDTLHETFRENPNAAVFGEIDIGSWVKMQLSGLGFPADIDFSSVSIDPALNRLIVERFERRLRQHNHLDMVRADALLTAHGQATPDVFIGDWGKTFAELDMLKRSKWKLLRPIFVNGELVRIDMVERPGTQLFWEVAFRKLEAGRFAEVDFPQMDLAKEPMLSLEMLRHGVHDVEHGPYSRGQKLVKMLKYAERSYFMNRKAVAEFGFNPYAENDPLLADVADKVIKNKNDPDSVADLLRALAGEEITEANVDAVTSRLLQRAKIAMHDNAARALAFRLNKIAQTTNEDTRMGELDRLWHDLETEIRTFQDTAVQPPALMVRALELVKAVMEGKLPPAELEARSRELQRLLSDAYKLPDSVIQRIMILDDYLKLRAILRSLGWVDAQIQKFIDSAKKKYPRGAQVVEAVQQLNEQLAKTTAGSTLLRATDWADNAFTIYEAYLDSANANEALWNASLAMGRIGLQETFPSLAIPLSIYDGFRTGSPKPVAMAVTFHYFPFLGQTYMVSQQLQRLDVAMRDNEFYSALGWVMEVTDFDDQGRIMRFNLRQAIGQQMIDSADISPPGNRDAIVQVFSHPESAFYVSPNFRYWASLVPKENDYFGRYEDKLQRLRRFFGHSEEVRYFTLMLEQFKTDVGKLPHDAYTGERLAALQRMEADLQRVVWVAMADMLESAAQSTRKPEFEDKIRKLEQSLGLGDLDLGAQQGLQSKINWEIRQNSSLLSGENPYAVGLIFDHYIKAYERIAAVRTQIILDIWDKDLGIDTSAAQTQPLSILLVGSRFGAPRLTGKIEVDSDLADRTLSIHRQRAARIRSDLADALGRRINPEMDKAHLRALGQLGIEWEHLLDACPERLLYQCDDALRAPLKDRQDRYHDYLRNLKQNLPLVVIEGPAETELNQPVSLSARVSNVESKLAAQLAYRWSEQAMRGSFEGAGTSTRFTAQAPGSYRIQVSVDHASAGKLAEGYHDVTVNEPGELRVTIQGPNQGKAGDPLGFQAELAEGLRRLTDITLTWQLNGREIGSGQRISINERGTGQHHLTLIVSAASPGQSARNVAQAEHAFTISEADPGPGGHDAMRAFRVIVPSIWAGASDAHGFHVKRESASGGAIYEMCPYPASVYGEVSGKVDPSFGPRSLDEIRQKLEEEAVEHRKWGREPEIRPFAIGPFQGFLLETRMRFARGGWSHSGYRDSGTEALGHGWVTLDGRTFEVSYGIGSSGCWDNSQRPFQESQTLAARREAQAILAGLRLMSEPGVTQVPYTGPKLDGSDLPVVRLDPPELGRLNVGDTVIVRAVVENLSPDDRPLRFEWTGEHEGDGGEVLIRATESGTFSLAVTVEGAQYALGSASLTYEVADYKVSVVRLPRHATGPVHIGTKAGFAAELTSGGQPVSGPFVFRWQPHPEVKFDRLDSNAPDVNAVFPRPGTQAVWAQVLQQRGDVLSSVAESPQIQIEVLVPAVTIEFDPPAPWAGQEVTARARMTPEVDADGQWITFRWLPVAGDVQQLSESADGREIRFYARKPGSITVEVMARTPFHGDSLGGAQRSIDVQPFQIDIVGPRFILPPERVVEHQIIEFSTLIRPDPGSGPLRYEWAITAGECTLTNPNYSEARVVTGKAGSCQLNVSVRDRNGSLLGTGTQTFLVASEGSPALIPTPAPPAAIGGPAPASPGKVAEEAIQFARVLTGATTGRQYHGYTGGQVVLPHREGGTLRFTLWNDQHQNPGATVNRLTIHVGETTYEVEQYSTALDLQERYQEVPDWGPGGGAVVTVPVPPGIAEVRFGSSGSQTGIGLSDLRFDAGSPGEPFGVVAHVNRTSEVQPQFERVLTGATTGRQYHGYTGGQVVLPHREGGTLRFTLWNDQHQNPGATVNRLTIHVGETNYEVEQYSTALDLQERYQEVPDWGPGGGAVVTVPVPPGIAEVRFGSSGSQTGIGLSDLRFDAGSPGEPFGVVAHVNRTSEVQPQFERVLTGATTGRQYHGYTGGQVVLPHREGGTLRFTLWNDQHEATERTVNQLTVIADSAQQSVPLTTSRAAIGERFRELPDWGPAGGKEVQVTVLPGTSTVTFHTQGSQTGMELSGFTFQHASERDPAQERLPEPRAATPPPGAPESRTPRPQSIPTVARHEVMQLPVVACASTGQVCEPSYVATFTGAGEVGMSYTAGDRHCADVAVRVRVDDLPEQETAFVSAGQTTASLRLALPGAGPHRLSVTGIGREGGCNTGALLGWTGSLTLEWSSPGL